MTKYTFKTTSQFRKDLKKIKKQNLDMSLLNSVISTLLDGKPLDKKYCDHALKGNYIGFRECHIRPDWLLIYCIDDGELLLTASRTGSHSDLI